MAIRVTRSRFGTGIRATGADARALFKVMSGTVHGPKAARTCRVCGCTDTHACKGGCWWVAADLCSSCESKSKGDN